LIVPKKLDHPVASSLTLWSTIFDDVLPANSLDAHFQTKTGKKRREEKASFQEQDRLHESSRITETHRSFRASLEVLVFRAKHPGSKRD
jgi:hypothetical protein